MAIKSRSGQEQLNKLDEETKERWNNYLTEFIPKLLNKDNLITILSHRQTLIRRINALYQEDNLYIDNDGLITVKELPTHKYSKLCS